MINSLLFRSLAPMMIPSMKNQVSKLTIAKNLTDLRKISGLTQAQLAEKLGYTDKAISKWEHAETLPDVITLATIADFYGVTLDYLTTTDEIRKKQQPTNKSQALNKTLAILMAVTAIWIISAVVYTVLFTVFHQHIWTAFVWPVPLSFSLAFTFLIFWGTRKSRMIISTIAVWTSLAAIYLELGRTLPDNAGWAFWSIFFIGIPLTVLSVLWYFIRS